MNFREAFVRKLVEQNSCVFRVALTLTFFGKVGTSRKANIMEIVGNWVVNDEFDVFFETGHHSASKRAPKILRRGVVS